MADVYVWDKGHHTGHASIEIAAGPQGRPTYVSFSPSSGGKLDVVGGSRIPAQPHRDKDDDIGEHGRPTDVVHIPFPGRAEVAMAEAYRDGLGQSRYQFWNMNCSTMVNKLLMVGLTESMRLGAVHKLEEWLTRPGLLRSADRGNMHGRWTEWAIESMRGVLTMWCGKSATQRAASKQPILRLFTLGGAVVAEHLVAKPGDVLRFATHIRKNLHQIDDSEMA